ncbi:UDP-2,3-diacylglucosamine diphosphatase [Shewanella maritima]|uniref:UDP-2,3-diacylglucosamine diphosphatase n=1 Tax=Shewanella maritima TaxID=2520507 RepID=UPI003735605A
MNTVFIGDLHLSEDRPDITQAFNQFLHQLNNAEALYIIGDLFEVWVGDDIAEPFALAIANSIRSVAKHTPVYFIHGNRDFMVGKDFCSKAGMTILPEVVTLDLYGKSTVVLHGDSLCTLDKAYQRFRKFRSIAWVRWLYGKLPKSKRLSIAANIRNKSKAGNQYKSVQIMDVEAEAVDALMTKTKCEHMIHGHTHRPAIHHLANNKQRIVVGDWYEQGSVLVINQQGIELQQLPFEPK